MLRRNFSSGGQPALSNPPRGANRKVAGTNSLISLPMFMWQGGLGPNLPRPAEKLHGVYTRDPVLSWGGWTQTQSACSSSSRLASTISVLNAVS